MKKTEIPNTDSIEELARFWDEHDLTDYEDELLEVSEPVFRRSDDAKIELHLSPEQMERLQRIASREGVEYSVLVQSWVLEKLQAA